MPLDPQSVISRIISAYATIAEPTIKIKELFLEACDEQGNLVLEKIPFTLLGPTLEGLDFSDCVIIDCDFQYLMMKDCIFDANFEPSKNRFEVAILHGNWGTLSAEDIAVSYPWGGYVASLDCRMEFLKYRFLPLPIFSYTEGFYGCNFSGSVQSDGDNLEAYNLGWKLHLSVDPMKLEEAFDLVAPLIAELRLDFKVVDQAWLRENIGSEDIGNDRFWSGAQVTVYLQEAGVVKLTEVQLRELIEKITQALQANAILSGVTPRSDAPTFSAYCSIRNDKFFLPKSFSCQVEERYPQTIFYIPAKNSGDHFNPVGLPNPYQSLLASPVKDFNFAEYFAAFHASNKASGHEALVFSCVARLRECTRFDELTREEMRRFRDQAVAWRRELDYDFLKAEYRERLGINSEIKMCMLIVLYAYSDSKFSFNNNVLFSSAYDGQGGFLQALQSVECVIRVLPRDDGYMAAPHQAKALGSFARFVDRQRDHLAYDTKIQQSSKDLAIRSKSVTDFFSTAALQDSVSQGNPERPRSVSAPPKLS